MQRLTFAVVQALYPSRSVVFIYKYAAEPPQRVAFAAVKLQWSRLNFVPGNNIGAIRQGSINADAAFVK